MAEITYCYKFLVGAYDLGFGSVPVQGEREETLDDYMCIVTVMDQHDRRTYHSPDGLSLIVDWGSDINGIDDTQLLNRMYISSANSENCTINSNPMIGLLPYLITNQFPASADGIDGKPVRKQILMTPPWLGLSLDEALEKLKKDKQKKNSD